MSSLTKLQSSTRYGGAKPSSAFNTSVAILSSTRRLCGGAGVRQLLEEKMNELVLFINSLMRDSTINPFRYVSSTSSRILSGEEEGVFEWITVNYLLGSFGQSH